MFLENFFRDFFTVKKEHGKFRIKFLIKTIYVLDPIISTNIGLNSNVSGRTQVRLI